MNKRNEGPVPGRPSDSGDGALDDLPGHLPGKEPIHPPSSPAPVGRLSFVVPVPAVTDAVNLWQLLLGIEPTFVDGDRWAQFDHGEIRLSLAGTDRSSDRPGPMAKVKNLAEVRELLVDRGLRVSEITEGPHELRAVATLPGGWPLILYTSK